MDSHIPLMTGRPTSVVAWVAIAAQQPPDCGWYVVAVLPVNWRSIAPADAAREINSWRRRFGFDVAWYNPTSGWFEGYPGKTRELANDRVTHWAPLPSVPEWKP